VKGPDVSQRDGIDRGLEAIDRPAVGVIVTNKVAEVARLATDSG